MLNYVQQIGNYLILNSEPANCTPRAILLTVHQLDPRHAVMGRPTVEGEVAFPPFVWFALVEAFPAPTAAPTVNSELGLFCWSQVQGLHELFNSFYLIWEVWFPGDVRLPRRIKLFGCFRLGWGR